MIEFVPFPKIARLSREVIVTEKIDGTNASVWIAEDSREIRAGSRTRWLTTEDDNFGFAKWVQENQSELLTLGPGHHFGEWWGKGIQRGYGLDHRRFSLFNTGRWADCHVSRFPDALPEGAAWAPSCCYVVPVIVSGFDMDWNAHFAIERLTTVGSFAAPGFMDPEGVVVYHTAANRLFKKTIKGDEEGKAAEAHPKKVKPPKVDREPHIIWTGGRRKSGSPYPPHAERRVPR